jgi:hypothetical protein
MHPGSIDYTYRVFARSILLDEKDRGLVEISLNIQIRSFCAIKYWAILGKFLVPTKALNSL